MCAQYKGTGWWHRTIWKTNIVCSLLKPNSSLLILILWERAFLITQDSTGSFGYPKKAGVEALGLLALHLKLTWWIECWIPYWCVQMEDANAKVRVLKTQQWWLTEGSPLTKKTWFTDLWFGICYHLDPRDKSSSESGIKSWRWRDEAQRLWRPTVRHQNAKFIYY